MLVILSIKTGDWELNISTRRSAVKARQQVLDKTLSARGIPQARSSVRFSEAVVLCLLESGLDDTLVSCPVQPCDEIPLARPLFFENMQYHFQWIFSDHLNTTAAQIQHKLQAVCDCFLFSDHPGRVIQGTIHTSNNIGWFRLPLMYNAGNQEKQIALSFEVLPVKMDLEHDLSAMYRTVDVEFPLWRFSLAKSTELESSRSDRRGYFPLLWLARFEELRAQLADGLKRISSAPHSRLMPEIRVVKADRIKGKVSCRLAEQVRRDQLAGLCDKHYVVDHKKLSVDTPENRFIKMLVDSTKQRLAQFHRILNDLNKTPENQLLSDAFLDSVKGWQAPLARFQKQPVYREIGPFQGMNGESLVLQQRAGYSAVYRVWQELKHYLDVLGHHGSVSMKSVADIYEVWCFLEFRRMLRDDLGFTENPEEKKADSRLKKAGFEWTLKDGLAGAFHFTRDDGVKLRLAHEHEFNNSNTGKQPIRIWMVNQKPDILLEAIFPGERRFVWLFDAKYRIRPVKGANGGLEYEPDPSKPDLVPDDAINQMHRYRDALIHSRPDIIPTEKSRPVFGAFALYPGFFNQLDASSLNPYAAAIDEVGIGAFPLLPSSDGSGGAWLKSFLIDQLGTGNSPDPAQQRSDRMFVREPARIPQYGMKQRLYDELTLIAALGGAKGRTKSYMDAYVTGSAAWYHIPDSTFSAKYAKHVAQEITCLAIATVIPGHSGRTIKRVWRVNSVHLSARKDLTEEQAGSLKDSPELYWLFELGRSIRLDSEVTAVPSRPFSHTIKISTLDNIKKAKVFKDIKEVYEGSLKV